MLLKHRDTVRRQICELILKFAHSYRDYEYNHLQ